MTEYIFIPENDGTEIKYSFHSFDNHRYVR